MDSAGHRTSFLHGYRPGDRLALAYKARWKHLLFDFSQEDFDHFAAQLLFRWFNIERSGDIANYRGPSMSVGDVVEIDGRAYAVDTPGFARAQGAPARADCGEARGLASTC